jgi:adenylylsulfate kinase
MKLPLLVLHHERLLLLYLQIEIKEVDGVCPSPSDMAEQVVTYLEEKGFLHE